MNFLKKHHLQRELLELEYKLERHYALSVRSVELEKPTSNILKKFFNWYASNHVRAEYELLSKQRPAIEYRIEDIKEELRRK